MLRIFLQILLCYASAASKFYSNQDNNNHVVSSLSEDLNRLRSVVDTLGFGPFSRVTTIEWCCLPKTRVNSFLAKYDSQKKILNTNQLFDRMGI